MKRTLSWLTLIGAALYAISTWPFADAVSVGIKNSISSETPSRGSPRESPPSQPSSALEQPVPDAAIDDAAIEGGEGSTEKPNALGETSGAVQAERLVVRSAANIRSRPSSKSTLIGTAQAGAELEVADREAGWVRFVDPATSYTGWIHEGLLTPLRSESAIERPIPLLPVRQSAPLLTFHEGRFGPRLPLVPPSSGSAAAGRSQDMPNFQQVRSLG